MIKTTITGMIFVGVLSLAACGNSPAAPVDPCQINPTKSTADGIWLEWDNEPLDADPCDSDEVDGSGHRKPHVNKTTKPAVNTPANPPKPPPAGSKPRK